jgi:hypothetical protein
MPEVVGKWAGPISLAILVKDPAEWMSLNVLIASYRECFEDFRNFVSIHVVIPMDEDKGGRLVYSKHSDYEAMVKGYMKEVGLKKKNRVCSWNEEYIVKLIEYFVSKDASLGSDEEMLYYPQNQMRNIARKV